MSKKLEEKIEDLEKRMEAIEGFIAFSFRHQIVDSIVALTKAVHLLSENYDSKELHDLMSHASRRCDEIRDKKSTEQFSIEKLPNTNS